MKRRFTILTAAIALLTILAFPMGVWGQSDYSSDYTGNVTLSTEGGENASECEIIISNTEYNGIKAGTSKNNGAVMITVPSGTKYLHIHAAAWNNTTCSLAVTPTGYSNPIALTANSGISNNSPFTFNGDANTSDYYKVITFSSALTSATNLTFTATGGKRFVIWGVTSEGEGDTPTCATPTFSPAAGTYTEAQNVTISCTTENATVYYTTDGSEPSTESSVYNSALIISETTTLKAMATATGYNNSPVASATYTITTPLTIAAVRAQGTGNVFTKGVVTSCVGTTGYIQDNTAAICVYGSSLTVGDEITVAGTLSTYKGLLEITSPQVVVLSSGNTITPTVKTIAEINDDDYTSSSSIQGLYITIEEATVTLIEGSNTTIAQGTNTIVVHGINGVEYSVNDVLTLNGNIGCFDGAQIANPTNVEVQQTTEPSITVTPTEVSISAEGATGALTVTCENIDDSYEIGVRFYSDPQTPATDPAIYEDWFEIVPAGGSSNDFHYEAYSNEGDARTAYLTICAFAANGEMLTESQLVTVNQSAPVVPATGDEYALYTGELVEGDYLIVYNGGAMNNTVSSNRLQYESVTVTNDAITTDNAAIVWHIAPSGDYWTLYNVDANAYAASTGTKNQAQMLADGTDDKALWTVSGTETYEFVNKKNAASSVNANLRKNGTYGFACYATSTGGALSLYKKVVEPETHTLYIPGYSNATNPKGGYYLIASPVTVNPEDVEGDPQGMIDGNFDLYYFDQAEENEWRNYEAQPFNLVPGKGYLYAHDTDVELTFTGTPYSGNREFPLSYTEDAVFAGWNLIGNPYNYNVTVDKDFYIMNEDGDEIITPEEGMPILPMQGFFVVATAAGQTVTFSKYVAPVVPLDELVMNLSQNRGTVIDRAIVRFGEGEQLPKFQLFENSTKLYIPQGNSDYAIVRSAAEGEMPVNFKAKENGTYTISVNTENVEMDYLHLIDNMTGTDVDLLQTPSYTFEASTRDYASRFRLVFSADENGASTGSATFAYFNGNEWVVSNEGDAQLHVIDMTGRIVSTETINGNATVKVNAAPGVYMLRLVNGNDIKTQKVIIK